MKNNILMSIKTKYANKIFSGSKKYEYRKRSIGNNLGSKIYIYSSGEDKAIIGYIIINKILKGDLKYILDKTSPVEKEDIIKYFENSEECYALHINSFIKLKKQIKLNELKKHDEKFVIPQYYRYLKENELKYIEKTEEKI